MFSYRPYTPVAQVVYIIDGRADVVLGDAPAVFSGLSPGRYALRVETDDGRSFRDDVEILVGSTTFVTATFR